MRGRLVSLNQFTIVIGILLAQFINWHLVRNLPPGAAGLAAMDTAMGFYCANHVQGLPVLLLVLAAIGCCAMSLVPVTWVVISEIFPQSHSRRGHVRGGHGIVDCML